MSHAQGAASAALGRCKIVIKEHLNIDRYREKSVHGSISDAALTGP
jgi:hypothetical protein